MADDTVIVIWNAMKKTSLRLTFITHFILITLANQSYWAPMAYFFYNIIFLFSILWSIAHKESEESVFVSFIVNLISVILDVIIISVFFPSLHGGMERFSVSMAILNLVIRPVSIFGLYKLWIQRSSDVHDEHQQQTGRQPSSYDSIDD